MSSSYSVTYEPVHLIHKEEFIEDKKAIAVKAVELINENDTIFLGGKHNSFTFSKNFTI